MPLCPPAPPFGLMPPEQLLVPPAPPAARLWLQQLVATKTSLPLMPLVVVAAALVPLTPVLPSKPLPEVMLLFEIVTVADVM